MPNMLLQLLFIFLFVVAISALVTGIRFLIHNFFDIVVERKMFFIYLIFYFLMLSGVIGLVLFGSSFSSSIKVIIVVALIAYTFLTEYLFIFKKYFDFEPTGKYILCQTVSYFVNFMLLILVINILITVLALLFA